ncbi:MAG: hydantoinase/oxoprolinase family protein, partial [Mariprofundaceae bacterium]|nr:hydantoinase/oxoprolinase family protein [Mariprofundaceae bacterium]
MLLGIDSGGTFTDFVVCDGKSVRLHKELSTPHDPSEAILRGIEILGLAPESLHLVHGSTVATNAVLERKGVKTLFVSNRGLEDLLSIGRQTRRELYNLCPPQTLAWTLPDDCFALDGRIDAEGKCIELPSAQNLQALRKKAEAYQAIAVCTLFSFLNPVQEKMAAEILPKHVFASLSHQVLPEYREYERASTTFLNAYVGPLVQRYLRRLAKSLSARQLYVMHSTGGVMDIEQAGNNAVRMILSGPAGGLVAAVEIGRQLNRRRLLSFDMGGTSTDVALLDGQAHITVEGHIADMPVAVPMLDIHTIGAGGGSIAWQDAAGLLRVGPQSVGAAPGPACYARGGDKATVTDANVVLGRIPPSAKLAGNLPLDVQRAQQVLAELGKCFDLSGEEMALAVIRIAEENMAAALRVVSVQRGFDPAEFSLLCFGGGGGLHACALGEALGTENVLLPVGSGAFSAMGMLMGKRQCDLSRSRRLLLQHADTPSQAAGIFAELENDAKQRMPGLDLALEKSADVRYVGQGFHLNMPWQNDMALLHSDFSERHQQTYGHTLDRPLELMTLRLSACADTQNLQLPELTTATSRAKAIGESIVSGVGQVSHFYRQSLRPGHAICGPALILEDTATLWLPPDWQLNVSTHGHLLLSRQKSGLSARGNA